jgi:hypothetical protein
LERRHGFWPHRVAQLDVHDRRIWHLFAAVDHQLTQRWNSQFFATNQLAPKTVSIASTTGLTSFFFIPVLAITRSINSGFLIGASATTVFTVSATTALGIPVTGAPPTGNAPTGTTSAFGEAVVIVMGVAGVVVVLAALDLVAAFVVLIAVFAFVLRVTIVISGLRKKLCLFSKQ